MNISDKYLLFSLFINKWKGMLFSDGEQKDNRLFYLKKILKMPV